MTDALKKMALALGHPHNTAARDDAKDALATLTPGSTWRTEDGVEVMVVPVEATDEMLEGAGIMRGYGQDIDPGYMGEADSDHSSWWAAMLFAIRKEAP